MTEERKWEYEPHYRPPNWYSILNALDEDEVPIAQVRGEEYAQLIARLPQMERALEAIVREGDPATATRDWPDPTQFAEWAIEQARKALQHP